METERIVGVDIKLAGSLSLTVSLRTIPMGFLRYRRDNSFAVLGRNRLFVLVMAAGSIAGAFLGGVCSVMCLAFDGTATQATTIKKSIAGSRRPRCFFHAAYHAVLHDQ